MSEPSSPFKLSKSYFAQREANQGLSMTKQTSEPMTQEVPQEVIDAFFPQTIKTSQGETQQKAPIQRPFKRRRTRLLFKETVRRRIGLKASHKNMKFALKGLDKIQKYQGKKKYDEEDYEDSDTESSILSDQEGSSKSSSKHSSRRGSKAGGRRGTKLTVQSKFGPQNKKNKQPSLQSLEKIPSNISSLDVSEDEIEENSNEEQGDSKGSRSGGSTPRSVASVRSIQSHKSIRSQTSMRSRGSQRSQIRLVKKEEQKASNFSKKPSNNAPPKDLSPDKTKQATVKISDLSKDELIEYAMKILKKDPEKRGPKEISALVRCMDDVAFFKSHDTQTAQQCLRVMQLETIPGGQDVFPYGSVGDKFYVTLRGSVSVIVPIPTQVGQDANGKPIMEPKMTKVRVLPAGFAFGELALMDDKPRAATIHCEEDCDFAIIDRKNFRAILKEKEQKKLFEEIDFLVSLPVFKTMSYNAVKKLFYHAPIVAHKRGEVLFDEGEDPKKMYIIKKGEFKLMKTIDLENPEENIYNTAITKMLKRTTAKKLADVAILGEKEIFGEEELIYNKKRLFRAVCHSREAEAYEVNKRDFRERVKIFSSVIDYMKRNIEERHRFLTDRIQSIATNSYDNRQFLIKTDEPTTNQMKSHLTLMDEYNSGTPGQIETQFIKKQMMLKRPVPSNKFRIEDGKISPIKAIATDRLPEKSHLNIPSPKKREQSREDPRIVIVDKKDLEVTLLPKLSLWTKAAGEDKVKRDKKREEMRTRFGLQKTTSIENLKTNSIVSSPIKATERNSFTRGSTTTRYQSVQAIKRPKLKIETKNLKLDTQGTESEVMDAGFASTIGSLSAAKTETLPDRSTTYTDNFYEKVVFNKLKSTFHKYPVDNHSPLRKSQFMSRQISQNQNFYNSTILRCNTDSRLETTSNESFSPMLPKNPHVNRMREIESKRVFSFEPPKARHSKSEKQGFEIKYPEKMLIPQKSIEQDIIPKTVGTKKPESPLKMTTGFEQRYKITIKKPQKLKLKEIRPHQPLVQPQSSRDRKMEDLRLRRCINTQTEQQFNSNSLM